MPTCVIYHVIESIFENKNQKACISCKQLINILQGFSINRARPDGFDDKCKNCHKIYRNLNYQKKLEIERRSKKKNIKQRQEYNKWYRQTHKNQIYQQNKEYNIRKPQIRRKIYKRYLEKNKEKIYKNHTKYIKNRRKIDPLFNLKQKIKSGFYDCLKRANRRISKTFLYYLGCSPEELKIYISDQFTNLMTWDKYLLSEIVIDHIIPYPCFDFNIEEDIKNYTNFKNLRPLWKDENNKKSIIDQKLGKIYKKLDKNVQKEINKKILNFVTINNPNYSYLKPFIEKLLKKYNIEIKFPDFDQEIDYVI